MQFPVTTVLLGVNVLHSTLVPNILNVHVCSSLGVTEEALSYSACFLLILSTNRRNICCNSRP
jgi:hypothetical protein